MVKRVIKHCQLAAQVAINSNLKYRIGAVIARKNTVLGVGFNQNKTHPKLKKHKYHDWSNLHAELHATMGVSVSDIYGSSIYVVRILKTGNWAMARPCDGCVGVLTKLGIKNMFYSIGIDKEIVDENII